MTTPDLGTCREAVARWAGCFEADRLAYAPEFDEHREDLAEVEAALDELARWREAARLTDEYTMHGTEPYPKAPFEGYICWLPGWSLYDVAHRAEITADESTTGVASPA